LNGAIVVFAAASLTDSFTTIAGSFGEENPGVRVTLNFGGSTGLAAGILAGAPADLFAAASSETMRAVSDAGLAVEPTVFARNFLAIAVPEGNPAGITGLADFADPAKRIALCAPRVPCGAAAARVLDAAGINAVPDTLEEDVRAALTKVELGEVDAALVYRTDVLAADARVDGIELRQAAGAGNDYSITRLSDARNPRAAAAFATYVLGPKAQDLLGEAGFEID
ncbi:MAG TPA: molybdate ABC transporter substrate-binding protein, partial [Marisediminicola sp.]|nr:molybdate ABC transporter substrate-binding protein [Marisediminicola sp.]